MFVLKARIKTAVTLFMANKERQKMELKNLIRFYFSVDKLNESLNNLWTKRVWGWGNSKSSSWINLEKLLNELINDKCALGELWSYLDTVFEDFKSEEINMLEQYAFMRIGLRQLDRQRQLSIKAATSKFKRKATKLINYADCIEILNKYKGLF